MIPIQDLPWAVRGYHPGDENALTDLFERVFGRSISIAHWLWKLKGLSSPVENVWLAIAGEKPVFQYAGIPIRYHLPGGDQTGMVSVDTMTAPEFRRRGLLTQVGQHAYDAWRAAGIPFVIGLPNEKWGSRTQALGWKALFPLQWLVRPIRPEAILARRLRIAALSRLMVLGTVWRRLADRKIQRDLTVQIRTIKQAGDEFDRLWQACLADAQASVIRDSTWVNWRYLRPPAFDYSVLLAEREGEAAGYIAYRLEETVGRKVGFIAELLTLRADWKARRMLIHQVLNRLTAEGAETVFTLAVPDTWLHESFRQAGFFSSQHAFSVEMVPLSDGLPMSILCDPQSWVMTGGDFDVI